MAELPERASNPRGVPGDSRVGGGAYLEGLRATGVVAIRSNRVVRMLLWPAVREVLLDSYKTHNGYLPHHVEEALAPFLGIKPGSLRKKLTEDLKQVAADWPAYVVRPHERATVLRLRNPGAAYDRLSAEQPMPPFSVFNRALWERVFDPQGDPELQDALQHALRSIPARCDECRRRDGAPLASAHVSATGDLGAPARDTRRSNA